MNAVPSTTAPVGATGPAGASTQTLRPAPFDRPGDFYRGNLHCHSNRSDGSIPPQEVVNAYKRLGHHFICLSDHFEPEYDWQLTDTSAWREESFTTLIGAELSSPGPLLSDPGPVRLGRYWLGAAGLPMDFAPREENETGPQLARRAQQAGAFVSLLHPGFNATTFSVVDDLDAIDAVEVYNDGVQRAHDRGDGWYLAVEMLNRGRDLYCIASDDAHFTYGGLNAIGGAWITVRSPSLDPAALLDALKNGAFYASSGPEIHDIVVDGREVEVHCSPAAVVSMTGPGYLARSVPARGWDGRRLEVGEDSGAHAVIKSAEPEGITCCRLSFDCPSDAPEWGAWSAGDWWRVTVTGADGRRAWSNPCRLGTAVIAETA
jgi:hypothetical protein